ncbi:MAG: hypothetical protein QOJ07_356 [Thermoleophilaceae bacterium]|nr:hypothetical protein [Thermoleophilaceae bacterium]
MTRSLWIASPAVVARLVIGLAIFGAGDALVVASELGNSPWTVLAEGVSIHTPLSIGAATFAIGATVLLGWLPLRTKPGLGTVLNVIVISASIDATLALVPHVGPLGARWAVLLGGIALVGAGSGLYLGAMMGPGPRDGLMTGINRRTGWPIAAVRTGIEASAVAAGWALGGTVGIGSLLFAVLIGPSVATGLALLSPREPVAARAPTA